jgi:thiol-disulfide isomerase/thioredoxin
MMRRLTSTALTVSLAAPILGAMLTAAGCACACRGGGAQAPLAAGNAAPVAAPAEATPLAAPPAAAPIVGGQAVTAASDSIAPPPSPEETTLTAVGQPAPAFTVATLDGPPFSLAAHRGKVVLVNWFATWCGPCKAEMPHLKSRVWETFGNNPDFVLISISREEEAAKVAPFVRERALPWTIGLDTDRAAYALYAEAYIPRNHVVGRDGRIVFQSEGFEEDDFAAMITAIASELAGR